MASDQKTRDGFDAAEIDEGIRGVVMALRAAGVETFSSCQGGGLFWGHGYVRPTVCFEGNENEGARAVKVATAAGFIVRQISRVWPTGAGSSHWEMDFVSGAAHV